MGWIQDIRALSHELGEWMDDPLTPAQNIVPAWGHIGQVSGCQNNLEVGDPVAGNAFTVTTGGLFPFTYHPEDLVFLKWFARVTPSTSVNGWHTFLNGFAAPQAVSHYSVRFRWTSRGRNRSPVFLAPLFLRMSFSQLLPSAPWRE